MNDEFTQGSSVTESQGDYSAPKPEETYSAPQTQPEEKGEQAGQLSGSYSQSDTQAGAYQQPNTNQNVYSQQNPYSNPGTDSYTNANAYTNGNTNTYTNTNGYTNGNTYSSPYQQSNTNQSQNLYYGQASQDKGESIGFGIASLVLGILSIFTFMCCINYILAILAIIFGIVQLVKSKKKGMAIAGIITAAISVIIATVFWVAVASEGADSTLKEYRENILEQEYTGV